MENNDRIIKFLAHEGRVSVTCINSAYLVEEARKIHDLSPTATASLGRVLTITAIMGADLKQMQDKINVKINGGGPIGNIIATSNCFPKVKAYISNPHVELPLKENGKIDVGGAVGTNGYLTVIKDIGLKEPYVGMVPLVSGEIAEDFTSYFASSEQKPTVVALGVLVDKNGVRSSGGYVISPMPDAKEEDIKAIEDAIKNAKPISKMLEEGMSLLEIAKTVTNDEDVKIIEENIIPIYECDCSKERFERGLISLGKKELQDIISQDENAEIICQFCNKKYKFSKEELEKIIENFNS